MVNSDVIGLFLARADAEPSKPAVSVRGQILSYGEFAHRVRRIAAALTRLGGPNVLIGLRQGIDAYAAMFGAGLAGCFYTPLNLESPPEKLRLIATLLQPDIIVAESDLSELLIQAAPNSRVVDPSTPLPPPLEGSGLRHQTAYIIFTSGTTGAPKGVVVPRLALDHFIQWIQASQTIVSTDRVPQFSNIAFDVSVTDIYGALCTGATLFPVLGKPDRMFPARIVAREKLTVWNSTPSVISLMMQAGEVTRDLLGSLRLVNTCGEPLLRPHLESMFEALPHLIVQNSYGPTETTVTMTELRLHRDNYLPACGNCVAIGDPIAGMDIQLIGGPNDDEGEIVIAGPQLASCYWDDPDKTAAAFQTVPFGGKPTRAYFSGDWAERRDGYLFFKERIDLQVKIRGFRLELGEVTRAIEDQGFPVVCVLKWQEELAAVIEQHPEQGFDEARLRTALAKHLEAHAVPSIFCVIDRIPRTQNDKLDRQAVAKWLDERVLTTDTSAP